MPEDEVREQYGDGTGWAASQGTTPPAPRPENQGASEAPPASDAEAGSSPAPVEPSEEQAPEQGTPLTTQPEPEKWNAPPKERWDEVIREKNEAQRLAQIALEKLQNPATPQPQGPPPADPWEGKVNHPDPATAQFYQEQKRLFEYEAQKVAQSQQESVMKAVDAGRTELAQMKIAEFRRQNPQIKPGSEEERTIAAYVQQGFDLETAKQKTLYARLEEENRVLKSKQASTPKKAMANNSEPSSGIPQTAGGPQRRGDWRDRASEAYEKGGGLMGAANAVFGGG